MCFYHSVAIKKDDLLEDDFSFKKDNLLEILGLNQIINIFIGRMGARPL